MYFEIDAEVLSPLVTKASKVSSQSSVNRICQYVKLAVEGSTFKVSAMNDFVYYEGTGMPRSVTSQGQALTEVSDLVSVVKTRSEGVPIVFELDSEAGFLNISQGEFFAKLPIYTGSDFPAITVPDQLSYEIELEPAILQYLDHCSSVIDTKTEGPYKGVLLDFESDCVFRICGFSKSLLTVFSMDVEKHGGFRTVLAPDSLPIISDLPIESLRLGFDLQGNMAYFLAPSCFVRVSFVEDKYPLGYLDMLGLAEYQSGVYSALSKEKELVPLRLMQFQTDTFLDVTRSVASVLSKFDVGVALQLIGKLDDGTRVVELRALNRLTKAKAVERLAATSEETEQIQLGLHLSRVKEVVSKFSSANFELWFSGPTGHIVLVDPADRRFVAVGIPVKIDL